MAPEAFEGRASPAPDVHGLAALSFHLVTGSPPFPGPLVADLRQQVRRGLPYAATCSRIAAQVTSPQLGELTSG
jgi:hypothetical protein